MGNLRQLGLVLTMLAASVVVAVAPAAADDSAWYHPSPTVTVCLDGPDDLGRLNRVDCSTAPTVPDYCLYQYRTVTDANGTMTEYEIGVCPTGSTQTDPSTKCMDYMQFTDGTSYYIGPKDCPVGTNSNPAQVSPTPTPTPAVELVVTWSAPAFLTPTGRATVTVTVTDRAGAGRSRVPLNVCVTSMRTGAATCAEQRSDSAGATRTYLSAPQSGYTVSVSSAAPAQYQLVGPVSTSLPVSRTLTLTRRTRVGPTSLLATSDLAAAGTLRLQRRNGSGVWVTKRSVTSAAPAKFRHVSAGRWRVVAPAEYGRVAVTSRAVTVR